jgi:RNA polymerase sigma-70 factor (ECF subfamily)
MARFPRLDAAMEAAIAGGTRGTAREREAAFRVLFTQLRQPVLTLCTHVTGHRADGEDAAQEAFVSVLRALPQFRGEARPSTWVYRIALHAALRVKARRPHTPAEAADVEPPPLDGVRTVGSLDGARHILAAMQRLPAEHRITLALFAVQELRHGEIAEVLGIPEGTVWSRLHAARKRLAAELGHPGPR